MIDETGYIILYRRLQAFVRKMANTPLQLLILSIAMILICSCSSVFLVDMDIKCIHSDVIIRPVHLRVVDGLTGDPLQNIPVRWCIRSYVEKDKLIFFIRSPEPRIRWEVEKTGLYFSDINGEVRIPERRIKLVYPRKLDEEKIFVNIDIKNEKKEYSIKEQQDPIVELCGMHGTIEHLCNPIKDYKGFCIISLTGYPTSSYKWGDDIIANELVIYNGLSKKDEQLTVKLEHRNPWDLERHHQNNLIEKPFWKHY